MKKQILKNFVTIITLSHLSFSSVASVWTKDDLMLRAKSESYSSQKSFEKLHQARRNISKKVGLLLPNFNLGTILNSVGGSTKTYFMPLQLVAPMIGFAFPSHWFSLKESKLIFEAEKRFYLSNVANNMNSIEIMYLEAHKTQTTIFEYQKIINDINQIIKIVNAQNDTNTLPFSTYVKLEILHQRLISDLYLLNLLFSTQKEEIGNSLALSEKERKEFELKLLTNLDGENIRINYPEFRHLALKRSIETKGGLFLLLASDFSIKKRKWDFISLTPETEGGMGFGYKAQIDIAKSEKKVLSLEIDEFNQRYISQLQDVYEENKIIYDLINHSNHILINAERYYDFFKNKLVSTNSTEFKEFSEAAIELLQAKTDNISLHHQKLSIEANYRRLIFEGNNYRNLIPKLWLKAPEDELSRDEKRENRKINKAIKKGQLILPEVEYF
jgi:hypothetical protein